MISSKDEKQQTVASLSTSLPPIMPSVSIWPGPATPSRLRMQLLRGTLSVYSSNWYNYWSRGRPWDRERLGGWPRRLLENEMKRGWIVLLAAPFIVLGAIVWALFPAIYALVMFAMQHKGKGCDEGPVTDQSATNARGDVVEEYIKVCTAVGSFGDYSILLQLHGDEKTTTSAEHSDPRQDYPKFRWLSDNALMIDLGKVRWTRSPVHKVARRQHYLCLQYR